MQILKSSDDWKKSTTLREELCEWLTNNWYHGYADTFYFPSPWSGFVEQIYMIFDSDVSPICFLCSIFSWPALFLKEIQTTKISTQFSSLGPDFERHLLHCPAGGSENKWMLRSIQAGLQLSSGVTLFPLNWKTELLSFLFKKKFSSFD
jgi:hypothetical protein